MQDVRTDPIHTEAKLAAAGASPEPSPTLEVIGALDVRTARDVYLNLEAAEVASVRREGVDLVLVDADGDLLRLEGFFEGAAPRRLFLEGSDDRVVLVDTGAMLTDGPVRLTLMPQGDPSPFVSLTDGSGGGGFGAAGILGGLAGVAGLAAAAGGGGGSGPSNPPPTPAPDTTAPAAATNLTFNTAGNRVSGSGEAGATVTIRNSAGAVIGTGLVGANGTFTVTVTPALTNGEGVTVTLTDAAGNVSPAATATAPDTTAPAAPGAVDVTDEGSAVTGTGEAGATVAVRGPGGQVIGTGTVGANGAFTITLQPPLTNGETVSVTLTDAAGNASSPVTAVAPDTTAPAAPAGVDVADDGASITGTGEAGATVTARGPDGQVLGTAVVGANGAFTITLNPPLIASETVSVTQADAAANVSPASTATAPDLTFPGGAAGTDAPVLFITEAAGGVGGAELSDGVQARVILTPGAQAGDVLTITVTSGGVTVAVDRVLTAQDIEAGEATVILPSTLVDGSYSAVAVIADGIGNASAPSMVVTFVVDTGTTAPVVTSANGVGLEGTAEAGATVTLLDGDGDPVLGAGGQPVTATVAADGSWTIPAIAVAGGVDGFTGSVRATDGAGNTASVAVGPVDGSTPAPLITGANGAGLTGTAEPGALILLDQNGQPVIGTNGQPVAVTVATDGTWSIPATAIPGGLDGFVGSVQAVDPAGNASATSVGPVDGSIRVSLSLDVIATDDVVNLAESQAQVTITGRATGEFTAGATVEIEFSPGVTFTGTLGADGTFSIPVPGAAMAAATSVTVTMDAVDTSGNTVEISEDRTYAVDLAGTAAVITEANGTEISGTAEPGATLTLIGAGGTTIATLTVGFDGLWTVPSSAVAGGLDGFTGWVRTIDAAGNPTTTAVGPIDGSTPTPVITAANGTGLQGTAEVGATVTLLNGSGSPVLDAGGRPISATVDSNGNWSIAAGTVPGGLDGFTGSVRAEDNAGNSAAAPVGPVDGATPTPVVIAQNGAGISGTAEPGAIILLDENGAPVIGANGQQVTATVDANGQWSIPAGAVPGGLDGFTGSVRAVDPAGNSASAAVGPIDGSVTLSLNVDVVADDNVVNLAESVQAAVAVSGRAIGDFTVDQTVTVTLSNGASTTTTLATDGSWTASFPGSALAASTAVTVTTTTTDASGNAVTITDVQAFTVDVTPPAAPVITTANGLGLSGTAEAGATLILRDANGGLIAQTTVAADGSWSVPAAQVAGGVNGFIGSVQAVDAAANIGDTPVGPVDGVTTAPVIATANGLVLTGIAEAGATLTLLGANGTPVLNGGVPVTVTVASDGSWTLPASQVPGGLDGFSGSVRAVDAAGNTATADVGPVDGSTPVPLITAANGSGLSGTAEAGASVALLDADGDPVLDAAGNPIVVTADTSGVWTVPGAQIPGGLDGFSGSVIATDAVGNTASATVGPIDGSISLTLVVDAVTADNVLNSAEAQAAVTVTGRAVGEFTVGQTVNIVLSSGATFTATIGANGVFSVSVPGAALSGASSITATTTATDTSGNTVTVSDVQTYAVDLSTTAPVIALANGAGLSGTAEAGAAITLRNGAGQTVGSTVADSTGAWSLPAAQIQTGLNGFSGSVQATDPAGNTAASPVGPVDGAINLSITVGAVTADNVVNIAESAAAAIAVSGTVAGEFAAGDTVTVTLTDGTVRTTTVAANGGWTVSFPGATLAASTDVSVAVTVTDAAGNTATVTADRPYGVDVAAPGAPVLSSAGVAGLGGSGEPGATIQLLDGSGSPIIGASGEPITAAVDVNGTWTIPATAFVGGATPPNFTGQLAAVDAAGNVSAFTPVPPIDVTPPDSTTTTVSINLIAGDDVINLAEAQGDVVVTGQVLGEYRVGDSVTLTAGTATFSGVVGANGTFSITVNGAALVGGQLHATVLASDAAGNVGAVTGSRPYTIDLVGPGGPGGTQTPGLIIAAAADGVISASELAGDVSAVVTLTPSSQAGDTVTLTLTTGGTVQTFAVVLTGANILAGQISIPVGATLGDGQYTARAVITDSAGNTTPPSTVLSFEVDTVPIDIGATTASVTEAAIGVETVGTIPVTGATGTVTYALQAPAGVLTSHGQTVTWAIDANGVLIGSAGGREVIRASITASGQYRIVLLDALDHPGAGADVLQIQIGVRVTDSDGTATGAISLGIVDGVPRLAAPITLAPTAPGVIVGDLVDDFGPDGGRLVSLTIDGRTFAYNPATDTMSVSGSSTTLLAYSVDDGVLSVTTVRGEAITVDFETGEYRVQVTGQDSAPSPSVRPNVALGGGEGLLGLVDADALGLIQLDTQQFFTASDANNDIGSVVVRYSAAIGLGLKTFSYNAALAAELGLVVTQANTFLLPGSSQLTIRSADGGAVDNLKLNEFLASITISGGLAGLLDLNVAQTLSIQATDLAGNVTLESESTLADLGVLAGLLGGTQPAQILTGSGANNVLTASDVGTGSALDNRMYGYAGNDTLNAGLGNDILRGGAGADTLNGGAGNDLLIGGTGNDTLNGGSGVDVFRWERGDQGTTAQPAADVVQDFNAASVRLGGDVLDFSSLLVGEGRIGSNPGNLANYIHFELTASGTLIHISTTGAFTGGFGSATAGAADQTILLSGVDLVSGLGSDQAILSDLLLREKLVVDTLAVDGSTAPDLLTIGGSVVDDDGDTGSTSVGIDSSDVDSVAPIPGNVAPVVELSAQNLLGLIGLGALGLNLNSQDLLAADANGNLSRVEVEYAPLVALNLSPLTFAWSTALAAQYGIHVQVTDSAGLLGGVAPSARIIITAADGGVLDNVEINRFLESVHLTDTSGGLLSSSLLSVNLLNALTVTAVDAGGLSSSAVIGSVVNVNALNSLDGPDAAGGLSAFAPEDDDVEVDFGFEDAVKVPGDVVIPALTGEMIHEFTEAASDRFGDADADNALTLPLSSVAEVHAGWTPPLFIPEEPAISHP